MATKLKIVSFNMHGFFQGSPVIRDMIVNYKPDVFLLQEHWLTPANLHRFDSFDDSYFSFGCSAMTKHVETGMLRGRPFGGVVALISNDLRSCTETIHCDDRYAIIRIANYILINVYMPCSGTPDRLLICDDLLADIWSWRERYKDCQCIIAGDFNVDLQSNDIVAHRFQSFIQDCSLTRCDVLFPTASVNTYVNIALNQESHIDYILTSCSSDVTDFVILDPDINFSDHLPLLVTLECDTAFNIRPFTRSTKNAKLSQLQLRWDQADIVSFYNFSRLHLQPLSASLNDMLLRYGNCDTPLDDANVCAYIDFCYNEIVRVLKAGAEMYVPVCRKNFRKFWWNQELDSLKDASIDSNKLWKAAGKPRHGPIFDKRQSCRLQYRKRIREEQNSATFFYSNNLHDALMRKRGTDFWKCWNSKFESHNKCSEVEGCVDDETIADMFVTHFSKAYSCNNSSRASSLLQEYSALRNSYSGLPLSDNDIFDTELVSKVISDLKRGKAADIDGLTAEHILHSHPILSVILSKLFQLILKCRHVPTGFRYSYTVPIPKPKDCRTKAMKCDDFRGISISPILSKIFEYCILDRFHSFF